MPLDKFENFQGNLKELRDYDLKKLKRSILKHGFSFPVLIWNQSIIDGHQRIFATKELISEGHTIDDIPYVEIHAESAKAAAEKLLMLNSRFAKMTEDGLYEFMNNFDLNMIELKDDIVLPDIDLDRFVKGYVEDDTSGGDDIIPSKDPNVLIRISFHPGIWLGKREEIVAITEKLKKTYSCEVKIEE